MERAHDGSRPGPAGHGGAARAAPMAGGTGRPGRKSRGLRIFYILVDEADMPHFEYFRRNAPSTDHMWGLRECDREVFDMVEEGDLVYMWGYDSVTIPICGRVSRTCLEPDVAKRWIRDEWTDRTRIIHFSHLRHINIVYKDFYRHTGMVLGTDATLFDVPEDAVDDILKEWPINDPIFVPPRAAPPVDLVSPPDNVGYEMVRAIRDTAEARELKEMYGNKCQVCGYALEDGAGRPHSEVHHVRPLHEGGSDTRDNMVVLCPRHHAEFDYGAMLVAESGRVVGRGAREGDRISFRDGHHLALANIMHAMKGLPEELAPRAGRPPARRHSAAPRMG